MDLSPLEKEEVRPVNGSSTRTSSPDRQVAWAAEFDAAGLRHLQSCLRAGRDHAGFEVGDDGHQQHELARVPPALHLDWLIHGLQRRDQPKVSIHHHEHAFHAPVLTQHDGPFSAVLIQKAYTGLSGLDGMI
jgi:hypothetical protein